MVCVLPVPGLDLTFDVHGLVLAQGLFAYFCQNAPRDDVDPVRHVLALAVGQRVGERHHNAERRDRPAGRRVTHLGTASKATCQRNPVQTLQRPLAHCVFRLDIRANDHIS